MNTQPFDEAQIARWKTDFDRDGFKLIPGVLTAQEVSALKDGIERVFTDERWADTDHRYGGCVVARLFETAPIFEEMLTREPIISLIESILGDDCHLIAQNAIKNVPGGRAIDQYHVDDAVMFPLGEGMERHDARLTMPIYICTVQIPLTDIPALEYGPTQYIPGSQYAGRKPSDLFAPDFEGVEPVSVLCEAGDIYLHNGQCWHRGAPNTSDTTRYLFQLSYGQRWVSQRFYPFINYQMPQHVLDNADERRQRVLGVHPKGAYG